MIHTEGLTKDFVVSRKETVHAVRGIDLDVAPGELVAILGPNGAGKTTTMRMLTTLLAPTSGTARVAGFDVVSQPGQVRRRIGYVGQGNGAGHNQRAADELYSQGVTYGLSRADSRRRAGELLESLDLAGKAQRKVTDLSGGQRRRLDVAMGLMHAPPLLVLDEPSTGLDPQNRANLWEHITAMRTAYDITVLLTTHYLDEADSMAERVVVVDHGEVIADDTPDALKTQLAGDLLVVTTDSPDGAAQLARVVERWQGATEVTRSGTRISARIANGTTRVAELVHTADAAAVGLSDVQVRRPTLDDVFLNLTGRSLRESGTENEEVAA
ncbi:ATP-binding cassette domain-containing protein [Occultella kanbiaonis]|uniref:ATP-binding cassette domain-containing protein n=1 Tax=Occultella kanbiaonis TaxID=2675754 RepID=UPI0012B927D8|nr:ATP-binding cassette domain-containing protein [Occultella kanbiaonis]